LITLGVFDSGVGGLSVLRDLQTQLPTVPLVYVADNAFAPYGERDTTTIQQRAHRVTAYLRDRHQIDALVIACNTATAHAIDALRATHPDLPIIGVEPALKPAAVQSASGQVGVLATRGTLNSERFHRLRTQVTSQNTPPVHFWLQACDGLAHAIEHDEVDEVRTLGQRYVSRLFNLGPGAQRIDTLVLGCTHYPFALEALQSATQGHEVCFIDTGMPVAKRARDLLLPLLPTASSPNPPTLPTLLSTGEASALTSAARRWIHPVLHARGVII
jgi:glutamate racemase